MLGLFVYEKRHVAHDRNTNSAVCIERPFLIPATPLLLIIPSSHPESRQIWSSKRTGSAAPVLARTRTGHCYLSIILPPRQPHL